MWPRKISLFGKGAGKLGPNTKWPTPPDPDVVKVHARKFAEARQRENKREFMQMAVVAMLMNIESVLAMNRTPQRLAERAEELYEAIEDRVNHEP